MKKTGLINGIIDDLIASTKNIHDINKENIKQVKADTKENFDKATAAYPDMEKFLQADGLKGKMKVVADSIKDGMKNNTEKEKQKINDLKHHDNYKRTLEEQRNRRQSTIQKKDHE